MSTAAAKTRSPDRATKSFQDVWQKRSAEGAPAWLADLRAAGFAAFTDIGLPRPGEEAWKYTSLRKLQRRSFADGAPCTVPSRSDLDALTFADLDAQRLTFINGRFVPSLSSTPAEADAAVDLGSLMAAPELAGDRAIGDLATATEHGFAALNQALMTDGAMVKTRRGGERQQSVYLVFLSLEGAEPVASHPRVVIDAAEQSELLVVEHYVGTGQGANLTNAVTEIRAGRGSRVEHFRIQEDADNAFHLAGIHARLAADARLTSHNVTLGSAIARTDIYVDLAEPGAAVELNGLYVTSGSRHSDCHTRVDHRAPHTNSTEEYRGILDGRSRGVFNGKAVVHPDAQQIDAHQSNSNLLLSESAEVDTKPELEIYADDVKCSHGATVGQLDESALFYLRSRGIGEDVARGLLTFAFAESVIGRITLAPVRRRLEKAVAGSLPDVESIAGFL